MLIITWKQKNTRKKNTLELRLIIIGYLTFLGRKTFYKIIYIFFLHFPHRLLTQNDKHIWRGNSNKLFWWKIKFFFISGCIFMEILLHVFVCVFEFSVSFVSSLKWKVKVGCLNFIQVLHEILLFKYLLFLFFHVVWYFEIHALLFTEGFGNWIKYIWKWIFFDPFFLES